ncbi:MAG: hypothetical protein EBV06_13250, partial [Planctomycetia bacterium]|nr:hypothetical protein [Planctomycetia bacterium]
MGVRAIVFDFGNVVGFFQRRRAAANLVAYGPPGLTQEEILPLLAHPEYEPLYEKSVLSSAQILELLRTRLSLNGTDEELAFAFGNMFEPNPAVCSLVPQLQGRYHLALLSNTNEMHYRVFRTQFAETLDQFDHLV